jgi:hypothetical protein
MTPEDATRYVLAECVETGETRCFARVGPRTERVKDPFRRRKFNVHYYPRHSLRAIYSGDRDFSHLEKSPFWKKPRLVKREEIPTGVSIP